VDSRIRYFFALAMGPSLAHSLVAHFIGSYLLCPAIVQVPDAKFKPTASKVDYSPLFTTHGGVNIGVSAAPPFPKLPKAYAFTMGSIMG
jgi:hypothetical protein